MHKDMMHSGNLETDYTPASQLRQPGASRAGGQCAEMKGDGERCKARALAGSELCYFHDPSKETERRAARRAGGISRSRQPKVLTLETPLLAFGSLHEVKRLLADTISWTLRGDIEPKTANAVALLVNMLLRAIQQDGA